MASKHVSKGGKNLLKNTIQSTDYQNKKLEERLMWQKYETKRKLCYDDNNYTGESSHKRRIKIEYTDKDCFNSSSSKTDSKYWVKKLVKEEEKQPDRWNHSGYKELYPDEFKSDHDDDSSSDLTIKDKKVKKSKKSKKKKKHKKKNKHNRK